MCFLYFSVELFQRTLFVKNIPAKNKDNYFQTHHSYQGLCFNFCIGGEQYPPPPFDIWQYNVLDKLQMRVKFC